MSAVTVVGAGDVIATRHLSISENPAFANVVDLLRAGDLTVANLEMSYPSPPIVPATSFQGFHMYGQAQHLADLVNIGINCVTLANNHALDFGVQGLSDTMENLKNHGLCFAGVGHTLSEARAPRYIDVRGFQIAMIGVGSSNANLAKAAEPKGIDVGRPGISPLRFKERCILAPQDYSAVSGVLENLGVAAKPVGTTTAGVYLPYPDLNLYESTRGANDLWLHDIIFSPGDTTHIVTESYAWDVDAICDEIREARGKANLVVVSLHAHEGITGTWNTATPADFLVTATHRFVDSGAGIVIGHGPHVIRAIEVYRDTPILYSTGNFVYMLDDVTHIPAEIYEQQGLSTSLPLSSFMTQLAGDGKGAGFHTNRALWESIVVCCTVENSRVETVEIHPIWMGPSDTGVPLGYPTFPDQEQGRQILEHLADLSRDFGTKIDMYETERRATGLINLSER
jgi:poly-gamma-glutamate synthesis protein (capsule biosynthesis protein)